MGQVWVRYTGKLFEDHADKSSRVKAKAGFVKQAEVVNTRESIHKEKSLGTRRKLRRTGTERQELTN